MEEARRIKVIHVGPHPLTVGGTQSVIRTIVDFGIGADDISVKPTWNESRLFANSQLVRRAAGAILRASSDTIIHVHLSNGGAYLRDGPLIALARARGLLVVVTIHGFDFPGFSDAHPRLVRQILSHANGVLCLSDEAKNALYRLDIKAHIKRLHNPVPIDEDAPPVRATEPVALFAGTIGKRKGVDLLIDAWQMLLDRKVEGRCRLVGPIDDYNPPRLDRMTIEDPVDPRSVGPLIRSSRVVVLPSRAEGMPMILTEALAAGRPFVATPVGGTQELAPCEEMIVPVDDAPALARAMALFLTDPTAAQRVGIQCQRFCMETRGPEIIGSQLRAFYQTL
ncbi:MAG TPA: glycosyltransferase family 4 protein [Solirubrobacteraceae bacterium]|nr:glycosyltransferase family 4 protein [Solirubrobacteraceae bacterium]